MAKEPTPRTITKKHMARIERERIQRRYLLIGTAVVALLVLGIILYGVLDQAVFQPLKPVAKVGSENITTKDFQREVRYSRSRMINELVQYSSDSLYLQFMGSYLQQLQSQLDSTTGLGQDVIDRMVEDILIAQEAEKRGITVTEEELTKGFEEAFGFFENGTPTPEPSATPLVYSTSTLSPAQLTMVPPTATPTQTTEPTVTATPAEATATATAKATQAGEATTAATGEPTAAGTPTITLTPTVTLTPTQYTREGFRGQVDQFVNSIKEDTGYTESDLRVMIRKQLLKEKVTEAITADLATSGEQVWVRHILVATEEEAKQVIDRLNKGESFAELAKELSTDTGSAQNGGLYDWFGPGKMVAPFEEAAYALNVGEISQPVKTDYGYHVIQLLGKENRPFTQEQIDSARTKAYDDWLTQAKEAADVVTYDDYWVSVTPADPEIPAQVRAILQQAAQSQQQQAIPDDLILPTEEPAAATTPEATEAPQQ